MRRTMHYGIADVLLSYPVSEEIKDRQQEKLKKARSC